MSDSAGPRNILLLNHNSRGVGTFYRCWHLARHLAKRGLRVSLLTGSATRRVFPQSNVEDGVRITETPNLLTNMYAFGSGYGAIGIPYRILNSLTGRFDLIHAFDHKANVLLPAIFRNKIKNTPLVADWSDWWGQTTDGSGLQERKMKPVIALETSMEEYIHLEADRVTTISSGLRQRAISLGVPPDKVSWIPSGAPSDVIYPLDKMKCREELGISPSTFLLGYVGSGIGDLEMMAPALVAVRKRRGKVRLATVGPIQHGGELNDHELRQIVAPFGRVPFHRLPLYLGACDAFVLPLQDTVFNRTRWPNKFGDYLAAGRPILCSDVGDVQAIVKEERCGLVWRGLDEFADGIARLIYEEDLAAGMGQRAREVAEGRLNWTNLTSEFLEAYQTAGAGA